jgi:hypothetical protein
MDNNKLASEKKEKIAQGLRAGVLRYFNIKIFEAGARSLQLSVL